MPRWKLPPMGTLAMVVWEDIQSDRGGDPTTAETCIRVSFGIVVGRKKINKRLQVVTSDTLEVVGGELHFGEQSGWCAYPVGAVVAIVPLGSAEEVLRSQPFAGDLGLSEREATALPNARHIPVTFRGGHPSRDNEEAAQESPDPTRATRGAGDPDAG